MGTDNLIVAEYIENLKEDGELDRIFPMLLSMMKFHVVATPKDSKGQPQYGKDVIAVGKDETGKKWKYYFELKGNADKNVTDATLTKPDGIIESFRAAKFTPHTDASIPGFNELETKYVLVHNGRVHRNSQRILDGFVKDEFPDGNFERWGIEKLTELFSDYLFSEYFLTDRDSLKLLRKTLVLVNSPEYNMADFFQLVQRILDNEAQIRSRSFKKMFASLKLVGFLVIHYSQAEGSLKQAKTAVNYLVLQTWAWILRHKLEDEKPVLKQFRSILIMQYDLLQAYFDRTLPFALETDGLSSLDGGMFEDIGYPLRVNEYLGDLVYFFELQQHYPEFDGAVAEDKKAALEEVQKRQLIELVTKNEGGSILLLDNHYISPTLLILFFGRCEVTNEDELLSLHDYISAIFINLLRVRGQYKRWPELYNNVSRLIEFNATQTRPFSYVDSSSVLIAHLLEILIVLHGADNYERVRGAFLNENKVDLQIAFPDVDHPKINFEEEFFRTNTRDITYVETGISLPEKAEDYLEWIRSQEIRNVQFRSDKVGFPFLKTLAQIFYKNDVFPWDWRKYLITSPSEEGSKGVQG